ncbi:hypothetical protein BJX68DRAFT_266117 [Aspergillus pseudodeflectus]|uniref:Zn(2)-C6 fungal-type domain-containing protein n=1 Tax=Aspergillus pseudodeflectus TaxID=176178 RepID=A0ABR4KG05_9EURO
MRPTEDEASAAPTPPKKVRLACVRCRAKRVKCDGGIPACSNCARAGVSCVDVDGRNNDRSIPRDYAARCVARIQWLEQQIKSLDAGFDLTQGPQLESLAVPLAIPEPLPQSTREQSTASTRKRGHSVMHRPDSDRSSDAPPAVEARSVAMDLGMLSLHSDSRQKHYLGSSSGLFFTNLIGADSEALSTASPVSTGTVSQINRTLPSERQAGKGPSPETYRLLYRKLSKELPSTEEANTLLNIYLQEIHIDHPFLHPTSLFNAYNALRFCEERGYDNVDHNGWPKDMTPFPYNGRYDRTGDMDATPISIFTAVLHVFMAFSLAATLLTRTKNFEFSPARFYKVAASAASECLSSISVPSLQSALLFTVQGMIAPTNLNIWTLVYVAMSHCIDLGLHREPRNPTESSPESLLVRRFIFYTVYNLDRSISTIQGRPLGIRDETFDIRMPEVADLSAEEPIQMPAGLAGSGWDRRLPDDLRVTIHRFKLDRYISEIKMLFYHLPTGGGIFNWPTDPLAEQLRIKCALDTWLAELKHICPSPDMPGEETTPRSRRIRLKLEVLYHGALALLYQPSQACPSPPRSALLQCYRCSSERIRIYNHLNNDENLYYNWRNIHGIFSSGASIVYCFWASPEIQSMIPFTEALRDLRVCSNLLSIGGQWWPSVRNGKDNFDRIVDLTIKRLSYLHNADHPSKRRRPQLETDADRERQLRAGEPDASALELEPAPMSFAVDASQLSRQDIVTQQDDPGAIPVVEDTYLLASNIFPYDAGLNSDLDGTTPVESVMENFFAEYLHGDWSWDPFSASLDTSIP